MNRIEGGCSVGPSPFEDCLNYVSFAALRSGLIAFGFLPWAPPGCFVMKEVTCQGTVSPGVHCLLGTHTS
jgi:hypothetical protein